MTSALHHSPSQAKREARRFNVLKAQRRRLLLALEAALAGVSRQWMPVVIADEARAAIDEVRDCRIVPLEDS